MMNRGANSDSIPMDLILEILCRLPAKSVARFRCVSKPWKSIICSQDFAQLFRTMSSSKPRLLVGVVTDGDWSFFSSPQPQNHCGKSSLVVAADFHTKFSEDHCEGSFSYASDLFYFSYMPVSKRYEVVRVICSPSTGQYMILPPHRSVRRGLLGFDPIGKQYKVLVSNSRVDDELAYAEILTLGTEKMTWREIKCPSFYSPYYCSGICINGVLYYKAFYKIGYFDVRSEKFKFLNVNHDVWNCFENLINYKGKLCGSKLEYGHDGLKLRMWVLDDFEKGEWSPYAYTLSVEDKANDLSIVGRTTSGEIVLAKKRAIKPFYVYYYNPDTNSLLKVDIQGFGEEEDWFDYHRVYCFVDHVEDINVDVIKTPYIFQRRIIK